MSEKHATIKDEAIALITDAFEGDFGEQGDVILSNKIVTVRKPRPCSFCKRPIDAGERARAMSAVFDGEMMAYIFCAECLNEMIDIENANNEDDAEGIDEAVDRLSERMHHES